MTWQILVSAYIVLGTASYLVRRSLAQSLTDHNRFINGFFYLCVLYPIGLVAGFLSSPDLAIGWQNALFILIGSCSFPIIAVLSYSASEHVDAGLYTILNNLTPIIAIIAAALLLNENLTNQQLLGAAVIITSAFLVTLPRLQHRSNTTTAGLDQALASVAILGLAIVYERWMLTRIGFGAYMIFGWGGQVFWMTVIAWPERHYFKIMTSRRHLGPILIYCITNALKGLCFVGALKLGNASLVSAFSSFMTVTVVISAYFVLREREGLLLKILAAIIGTAGLVILNVG